MRARLTLVFALATLAVLAGAGAFVHARLKAELDESIDETLVRRAATLAAGDPEDTFVRRDPGTPDRPVVERRVPGFDEPMRVLARDGVVVGESVGDRDETLSALVTAFAIGGPIAVLLAALLGYGLATAAVRPIERAYARERRFVADASHELRTPIAVVRTELETASRTGDPAAVAAALEETERLARLADDLLVLARAGEGKLPVRPEWVDARTLTAGLDVQVDAPAGARLYADPLRARQVLANLVDNARRHGTGVVTVRARDGVLEVSDEGPGFEDAMFERFARGDASRSGDGAGLGLALVRAIAEAHGGSAEVDGATVRVRFPSG